VESGQVSHCPSTVIFPSRPLWPIPTSPKALCYQLTVTTNIRVAGLVRLENVEKYNGGGYDGVKERRGVKRSEGLYFATTASVMSLVAVIITTLDQAQRSISSVAINLNTMWQNQARSSTLRKVDQKYLEVLKCGAR